MAGYVEVRAYAELSKDEVIEQIQPLTRRYYDDFSRRGDRGRVYWRGSHRGRLVNLVARLRDRLQGERSDG